MHIHAWGPGLQCPGLLLLFVCVFPRGFRARSLDALTFGGCPFGRYQGPQRHQEGQVLGSFVVRFWGLQYKATDSLDTIYPDVMLKRVRNM